MEIKRIVVLSRDPALVALMECILNKEHSLLVFTAMSSALEFIYTNPPELVIVDMGSTKDSCLPILKQVKEDPIFSQIPLLAILEHVNQIPVLREILADDYITRGNLENEFISRVELCLRRSKMITEVNPLTRLPGNNAINRQIQERLDRKELFGLAYADLDCFKPYNDKYGFSRGDEVIKFTGRLILNLVKDNPSQDNFVGHIGGDDFVFITSSQLITVTAEKIISAFDQIIPTFYDEDDRLKGVINSVDRRGQKQTFPIIAISIGIATNQYQPYVHFGEMTSVASSMKSLGKQHVGSVYKIDQRKSKVSRKKS